MKTRIVFRCEKCREPLIVVDLEERDSLKKKKGWRPLCNQCRQESGMVDKLKNIFGMR